MAFRMIEQSFWTDSKVDDEFTPEDKYFYMYLLTNPHTNMLGCYEISMKQMERETGYNEDTIKRLIDRMENNYSVIKFEKGTKEMLIKNWYKYNWTNSKKVLICLEQDFKEVKSESLKCLLADILAEKYGIDTLSIPYPYPMDITNNNNKNNNKNNNNNNNTLLCNTDVTKCNTEKEIDKDNKTKKQKSKNLLIEEYTDNEELRLSLQAFVEMRKTIKKPLTDYAMKLALNSLTKLSSDDDTKIMIVNNSVQNSWQGFYELKNQSTVPSYMDRQKNGEIHDTKPSKEALERAKALQESLKS